jgi:hypothetical protein
MFLHFQFNFVICRNPFSLCDSCLYLCIAQQDKKENLFACTHVSNYILANFQIINLFKMKMNKVRMKDIFRFS